MTYKNILLHGRHELVKEAEELTLVEGHYLNLEYVNCNFIKDKINTFSDKLGLENVSVIMISDKCDEIVYKVV